MYTHVCTTCMYAYTCMLTKNGNILGHMNYDIMENAHRSFTNRIAAYMHNRTKYMHDTQPDTCTHKQPTYMDTPSCFNIGHLGQG